MLTLTRRLGERIVIGADIEIEVVHLSSGRVRIGIRAPRSLPVHRGELVDRIEAENRRARDARAAAFPKRSYEFDEASVLTFPEGLFGMRDAKRFVLCELEQQPGTPAGSPPLPEMRVLVSVDNPMLRLLVVDALEIVDGYPVAKAQVASGLAEQIAVAGVVTAPCDGSAVTVNLAAPIVIGLESHQGAQVIVEAEGLEVVHVLSGAAAEAYPGTAAAAAGAT